MIAWILVGFLVVAFALLASITLVTGRRNSEPLKYVSKPPDHVVDQEQKAKIEQLEKDVYAKAEQVQKEAKEKTEVILPEDNHIQDMLSVPVESLDASDTGLLKRVTKKIEHAQKLISEGRET